MRLGFLVRLRPTGPWRIGPDSGARDRVETIYHSDSMYSAVTAAMARLGRLGIGTRPFFWPMHEQPVWRGMGLFAGERHPVAERLARRGFYLPSGMALTDAQIELSAGALREILQ